MNSNISDSNNTDKLQMAREYARQDLPRLLALCARLIRTIPEGELEPYAAAIAEEACAANTVHDVVRALAIDDEAAMRAFAAQVLQHCPPGDEILLGLAQWLATDREETVTEAAFRAIGRWIKPHNPIYKLVIDMLHSKFVRSRQAAIRILSNASPDSGAVEALLQALKDEYSSVRWSAAEALGKLGDVRAVEALLEAMKDEYSDMRLSVAEALEKLGEGTRAVETLLQALKNEDWWIRRSAAEALGKLGDVRAVEALLQALEDENSYVRQSAAEALGKLGDVRAIEALFQSLKDGDWPVRQSAAEALGKLGERTRAVEVLLQALKYMYSSIRRSAAEALGKLGDVRAVEALLQALKDEGAQVRQSSAEALGRLSDLRAVEALLQALKDEDNNVCQSAAQSLEKLGEGDRAVEALLQALRDGNSYVRQSAVQSLGKLGEGDRAVEALLQALKDEDSSVRQSAAQALGRFGRGEVHIFSQLEALEAAENADLRYAACLALKSVIAISPERVFRIAERNLGQSGGNLEHRSLFLEMIGRCAFLGVQAADEAIRDWSQSQIATERSSSATLLGELLPLKPKQILETLNHLAQDGDWTVREAVAMPMARRSLFYAADTAKALNTLAEDKEISVVFAASAALQQLTGGGSAIFEQRRLRRYTQRFRRSQFFERWLNEMQEVGSGFAPFAPTWRFFNPRMLEELLTEPELPREEEEERRRSPKGEKKLPRPRRQEVNYEELRLLLREFEPSSVGLRSMEALERLLQLLPEPLVLHVIYKGATDEQSRSVCRLFYELASLVEKVESAELFRGREEARLRRQLPEALERLARGFGELPQFEKAQEYAARFLSLRHLLAASSLSEILTALAASEKDLSFPFGRRRETWGEGRVMPILGRLNEAVSPLRQYSAEAPISLRTLSLSETISNLEGAARYISFEGIEPYRTILLQVASNWQELLRLEIRRLEGEAKLEFSTSEEVTSGEIITIVLEIRNRGPAPASNLRVKLIGKGLADVNPDIHTLPSLAANEIKALTFTALIKRGKAKKFITEFVITYDDLLAKSNERQYTASIAMRAAARAWKRITNPYSTGMPDPDSIKQLFVGREDVLRFIEENLVEATNRRIVVLYGHRRTGKTWTLLHLQEYLPATYLPVYIDIQGFTGVSGVSAVLQIFAGKILDTLKERCAFNKETLSKIRIPIFEQYERNYPYYFEQVFLHDVQEVLGEQKLLWLFDEFQGLDDMVNSGRLPGTFMEYLRHLMQFGKKMTFIFAGTREMTGKYWSVFFNIALQRKIGVLDDDDAEKLIINPVRTFGVEHDRFAVPLIRQLTGNHPHFIQLLCNRIVSELNAHQQMLVNAQIIESAADDMVIKGDSNLMFYWAEVMDERERAVAGTMQELLRLKQPANVNTIWSEMSNINPRITSKDVSSALKSLVEKELLEKDKTALDTYKFKIGLVERYIGAHVPYAETQERIGKLW